MNRKLIKLKEETERYNYIWELQHSLAETYKTSRQKIIGNMSLTTQTTELNLHLQNIPYNRKIQFLKCVYPWKIHQNEPYPSTQKKTQKLKKSV